MNNSSFRRCTPGSRSGSALICVLVALLIVMGLTASMLKTALQARDAVHHERQLGQTLFLMEAGIQRAVGKLSSDGEYRGETWRLDSSAIPGHDSAVVEITVTPGDNEETANVQVVAKLPAESLLSIQRTYHFPFPDLAASNEE
jgi:Tfp pilus assembly protein PilV